MRKLKLQRRLAGCLFLITLLMSLSFPSAALAGGIQGESGTTGEVEFYVEEKTKSPNTDQEKPSKIRLPQTGTKRTFECVISGLLLIGIAVIIKQRYWRRDYD